MKKNTKDKADKDQITPDLYTTLKGNGIATLIEKKSEFIGYASHVKTEQEALDFLAAIRKKHSDATHNVYAYMIKDGNLTRFSDDGEPSGTAGMPVLDVIRKSGFTDAIIVVTRYFGGTLLGTGGLVRAYSAAAKAAAEQAVIVTYEAYTEFELSCSYSDYEKLKNEFRFYPIIEDVTDFSNTVDLKLAIKETAFNDFNKKLSELTAGSIKATVTGSRYDHM